jgi:hypothetical protein
MPTTYIDAIVISTFLIPNLEDNLRTASRIITPADPAVNINGSINVNKIKGYIQKLKLK